MSGDTRSIGEIMRDVYDLGVTEFVLHATQHGWLTPKAIAR